MLSWKNVRPGGRGTELRSPTAARRSILWLALLCLCAPVYGESLAQQRLLPLASTSNTRDLGGYSNGQGQRVKSGMLYRSDSLAHLDLADLETLAGLRLASVADFRSQSEREGAEDRLPEQVPPIDYRVWNVNNPALDIRELGRRVKSGELNNGELEALLDRTSYIDDPDLRAAWGDWLHGLAEPGALPQLFHCTAGKDRTGFAAALVLMTLGVERDQVMEDFLLSNHYLATQIEAGVARVRQYSGDSLDPALLAGVLGVSARSLKGAIAAMESRYGSVQGYIESGLGVDMETRQRLRELLLEDCGEDCR